MFQFLENFRLILSLFLLNKNVDEAKLKILWFLCHLSGYSIPFTTKPYFLELNFKAHANGPNIVGQQQSTLLGPTMLWLVASVCMEPQCWHLLALVAYSLKPVKCLGPCKRTQHCWPTTPSHVGSCWHLLCPFAWAFRYPKVEDHTVFPVKCSEDLKPA